MQPLVSRTVFDSISEQIIIINTESYTIIDANKALLNQLKLKREEVIGKSCYEITHKRATRCVAPDDLCPIGEMLEAGKPITVEHTHYDADCKPFYVEVSAYPIKDSDGKINYAIHIAKDISERKRLEKELLKFKLGVERAGEIVFITELDGTIVYVNPLFELVYGYAKEEALGKTPRILKSGILSQEIYKQFWDTLLANQNMSGEIINKTKDNSLLTIDSTSNPITDKHGKMVGFLAIQRDITDRKKIEEALKESETRLNMAQRIAKLGSWEYYVNEDRAIWSEELFRIFGLKPQPYGPNINSYINLIHPEDRQKVLQEVQRLNRKVGERASYDYRILLQDGSIRFIHSESMMREVDEHGIPKKVSGIEQDITERKQIEEKLEQYSKNLEKLVEEKTNKLRDSERLAAIGEVAGMVGHDIRNPLQTIVSELYFAKESLANFPECVIKKEALDSADVIQKQVDYINNIVADLQDYSKPLEPKLVEIDLCEIITQLLKAIAIPNGIQLIWSCGKIAKLKLDPTFIRRILTNLINNAIQAMPVGGKLTVKAHREDSHILLTVEDTGVGISKEAMGKLFTPLFTTKTKGQGFGLVIIKRMTEALGGSLTVESEVGLGTKFILRFKS